MGFFYSLNAKPQGKLGKKSPQPKTLGVKAKPSVSVEVQVGKDNVRKDVALYEASCKALPTATFNPANKKVDLTSRKGLRLGNQFSSWGGSMNLTDSDISATTQRGCRVRYSYDVVNVGQAKAQDFTNRITVAGKPGDTKPMDSLSANQSQNVSGTLLLPAGTYSVGISIDQQNNVEETKENNNQFSVQVTVPQKCGGSTGMPTRPQSHTGAARSFPDSQTH